MNLYMVWTNARRYYVQSDKSIERLWDDALARAKTEKDSVMWIQLDPRDPRDPRYHVYSESPSVQKEW